MTTSFLDTSVASVAEDADKEEVVEADRVDADLAVDFPTQISVET